MRLATDRLPLPGGLVHDTAADGSSTASVRRASGTWIVKSTPFGTSAAAARSIAGSGLYVGRQEGEPVTQDYPGQPPHRFTGGTIDRVAIDVSGEPYLDLEREAALMLMRE